jgi:dTMP kinase
LKKGFFIVFEGPDGSGKSTQVDLLSKHLEQDGHRCIITAEPGGTDEGIILKDLILNPRIEISKKTELFLFLADRAEHVDKVIGPSLSEGKVIICSRYLYSTLVYQGVARRLLPNRLLKKLNLFAVNDIVPDVVFYLDCSPEDGLSKAKQSSEASSRYQNGDRIEREGIDFQKKVREGYLKIARQQRNIFVIVRQLRGIEDVQDSIYQEVKRRIDHD